MKINIQHPPQGSSLLLTEHLNNELTAFAKSAPGISGAEVRLRQDKGYAGENKICEIYLSMVKKNIFAIQKGRTYEESATRAIKKLQQHLDNQK